MYNNPYFIPNMYQTIPRTMLRNASISPIRNINIFSKLGNTIKNIKWSEIINNTSKTLGIINQTIPVVKQVKPIMNNMKSMIKIASLFKDETTSPNQNISNKVKTNKETTSSSNNDNYSPTFFIA